MSEKIMDLLEKKSTVAPTNLFIGLVLQKIMAHIQLKQYKAGQAAVHKLFLYIKEGEFNWFKGQELYLYLLLHTKNYQHAYTVFNATYTHKKIKTLPAVIKEIWEIFRAYLHYLIVIGQIQAVEGDPNFKQFRIARFVNEVPTYAQDKRGLNIAILVIQIIFSIQQKKYDTVIDRMEAVEKYSSRYLKKNDNFRSNCFIKLLMEVPKGNFHPIMVRRKTEALSKRLAEMPLDIANQTHSIEIIPYEDLWEMVVGNL